MDSGQRAYHCGAPVALLIKSKIRLFLKYCSDAVHRPAGLLLRRRDKNSAASPGFVLKCFRFLIFFAFKMFAASPVPFALKRFWFLKVPVKMFHFVPTKHFKTK